MAGMWLSPRTWRASRMKPFRCPALLLSVFACALAGGPVTAGPAEYLNKPDDWFRSDEGRRITANLLSHQSTLGSWPKNLDTAAAPYTGDPELIVGTFDNRATTDELRFLARAFNATHERRAGQAFIKGLDHILR